jgi:peroxiredoxin
MSSTMLALGTRAPAFSLPDVVTGRAVSSSSFDGSKLLLVMFICRHCPYVQHVKHELARLGRDYAGRDVGIVAISSNDASAYPEDAPPSLRAFAEELELPFPLLYDDSQDVAKAYSAACTPDFFLFDRSRALVYRGQLDDSRPSTPRPVDGADLRAAIEAALADAPVSADQRASIGCSIKWRAGRAPTQP